MRILGGDALLIVDVQRDFVTGGSLAVPGGEEVVPPLNRAIDVFEARDLPVFFSRDWHPADHCSFVGHGGVWPPHCVAGTPGARFAGGLVVPPRAHLVSKATEPSQEAYSAFERTGLGGRLHALGIRRLVVGGLATDYCVLNTVLDARRLGFPVVVLADAIRAVDARRGDGERALTEMRERGAEVTTVEELLPRARAA